MKQDKFMAGYNNQRKGRHLDNKMSKSIT